MSAVPPKSDADKKRSSLLFWLGCASVFLILLLVAVGITMMVMLRRGAGQSGGPRSVARQLPADWRGTMRADAVLPPESALAPPRTGDGDAARVLYAARIDQSYLMLYLRLTRHRPLEGSDAAALASLVRDTAVNRIAAAASLRDYHAVPLYLADSALMVPVAGVRVPSFGVWLRPVRAVETLVARGVARAHLGQVQPARADLSAAIGLGLLMYRREPSLNSAALGLRLARDAAAALRDLPGSRDTATAAAAARLVAWAEHAREEVGSRLWALYLTPDSLLAAATDTTLPFPLRADAIHGGAIGVMMRGPWSVYRGPTRGMMETVRTVERDRDSDLAALALAFDSALARIDRVGGWTRLQWLMHGRR